MSLVEGLTLKAAKVFWVEYEALLHNRFGGELMEAVGV